jgi:glycosyltransferase involved in cell wall biosynthesis
MKVALVTGTCREGTCGVGDYTRRLASALEDLGVSAELMSEGHWGLLDARRAVRSVESLSPDIIHIQYPTSGFGYRLGPQFYALRDKCVTTFHEASQAHILRKISLYPFTIRARHVIFTSECERQFVLRWAPWIRERSSVIPIGSNVEAHGPNGIRRNFREIVYFGLLVPRKGLDDVLRLAALVKERGLDLGVRLVGSPHPKHGEYLQELRRKSEGLPVIWDVGLPDSQVSCRLAGASIAYLPYPDGASERRTTLKAALSNGMAVVTTRGSSTPAEIAEVVRFAASPAEAVNVVQSLLADESERLRLTEGAARYIAKFSWSLIAEAHCRIYQRLVNGHTDRN